DAAPGASAEAAIAQACHDVLVYVYPAQAGTFDAELVSRLALIPVGPSETDGIAVGSAAAAQIIAARANDGSTNNTPYTFGTNPGDFRIPEDIPPGTEPFSPNWGLVTPFAMTRGSQFRRPGPGGFRNMNAFMHSRRYADNLNEVKSIGSRTSTTRTADQTALAFFWANDVNGTYKPPGHLLHITEEISTAQGLTLAENARLFGLMGLAMGDAGIVAWDMKYLTPIDLWRPITGIRLADTDGNPHTQRDTTWLPLNSFTPPFPAWTSGHATFGAAHAAVLGEYFGTDQMTFTITSEDPFYAGLFPGTPPARTFHRFSDAAWENAMSRLFLGVHWRVDAEDANISGTNLGRYIGQNFFRPACPADFNGDGHLNQLDFFAFLSALLNGDDAADFNHDGHVNVHDFFDFLRAYFEGC
ncbi:MAG: GC-type dockerin domain-anchored protein, partial [Phycisphaerales bacterium]